MLGVRENILGHLDVTSLLTLMKTVEKDESILVVAMQALGAALRARPTIAYLSDLGSEADLQHLGEFMVRWMRIYPETEEIQTQGLGALSKLGFLCYTNDWYEPLIRVLEKKGVLCIVKTMERFRSNAEAQIRGIVALGDIAVAYHPALEEVEKNGGIDRILRAMAAFPDHRHLQATACRVMAMVSHYMPGILVAKGGIPCALRGMHGSEEAAFWAFDALENVTSIGFPEDDVVTLSQGAVASRRHCIEIVSHDGIHAIMVTMNKCVQFKGPRAVHMLAKRLKCSNVHCYDELPKGSRRRNI